MGYNYNMTNKKENTHCYTYKVEMIIQVLAEDEETALDQLEKNGGYVTSRKVDLVNFVLLHNGTD